MDGSLSRHFGWVDYLIFATTLALSLFIGIYHAWKGSASSTADYLLGGKSMGIFPIAMSLAASAVSTTSMLGMPTDVYLTGAMMFWMIIAYTIGALVGTFVYMPLFQELGVLSINQYLELRFHRIVRMMFSGVNIFATIFYLSMVIYGPSLVLSQVTGVNVYISASITFAVCTFYTTIGQGGMKAVVWSDTLQIFLMVGSMLALVIKGLMDVGVINVWERNLNSGRLEFLNTDFDPTTQKTVWSMVIGGGVFWSAVFNKAQGTYQRFLAVPTRRHAQKALMIHILLIAVFLFVCYSVGLVAYSKYFDCDPISAKFISRADQIVPYFVMDTIGSIPGLSGLFVAGMFSASLSTLSTVLNGSALTILEDFVRPCFPYLTDGKATTISKWISFGIGFSSYLLVFLLSNIKTIVETGLSIDSAVLGMSLGVFSLGMLVPWANTTGAIVGMMTSYAAVISFGVYAEAAKALGTISNNQMKPTSIQNCPNLNESLQEYQFRDNDGPHKQDEAFYLLRISYLWYTLIGALIVIVLGTLVSLLTGLQNPDELNPKLVFRFMRRWIGRKRSNILEKRKNAGNNHNIVPISVELNQILI